MTKTRRRKGKPQTRVTDSDARITIKADTTSALNSVSPRQARGGDQSAGEREKGGSSEGCVTARRRGNKLALSVIGSFRLRKGGRKPRSAFGEEGIAAGKKARLAG